MLVLIKSAGFSSKNDAFVHQHMELGGVYCTKRWDAYVEKFGHDDG